MPKYALVCKFFLAVWCLSANVSWASIASCSSGVTLDNYQPASLSSGCAAIDKSYSNFVYSAASSSAAQVSLDSGGSTLNSSTGLAVADFNSSHWCAGTGAGCAATFNNVNLEYVVESHTGGSLGGYTWTNGSNGYVDPAAQYWGLSTITLDLSPSRIGSFGNNANNSFEIQEIFCLGNTALSFGSGACAYPQGSSLGYIDIFVRQDGYTYGCSGLGFTGSGLCTDAGFTIVSPGIVTFTVPQGVTAASIEDSVRIQRINGTDVDLNTIFNSFGEQAESPEPATLGVVGAALASLVLLAKVRG